jgi:hypothetical protein
MAVIPSLLSERRAAVVSSTPATAGLPRRRVGTKVRPALQRLLWRAHKLDGTQDLHSMIQTLTDCRFRRPTLPEKREYHAPNTPLPRRNGLVSSTHDTPTCESTDGGRKDIEPDLTAGKAKGDWWDDEEEEPDGDNDENNPLLLRPTKQQCRSTAGKKSSQKRGTKRRRFSSPLSFNEEAKMGDELNIGSYTPSRPHHLSNPRSPSFHSTGFEGDTINDGRMGFAGGQSWMVVICEQ